MMVDLPAPVGPVSAKRSTSSKSISTRSRKVPKPSMMIRSGRTVTTRLAGPHQIAISFGTRRVVQQLVEQRHHSLVVDVLLAEVELEQLSRRAPHPIVAAGRP